MKKVYLQPAIKLANSNMSLIIATSYTGTAGESHGGGSEGTTDPETTPSIGGTGDDDGFTLGSKRRGNLFYD